MESLPILEHISLLDVFIRKQENRAVGICVNNWPDEPGREQYIWIDVECMVTEWIKDTNPIRHGKTIPILQTLGRFAGTTLDGKWEVLVSITEPGGPMTYTRTKK